MSDLVEKMEECLSDTNSEAYGRQHMKTKLLEYFGDKIVITDINGEPKVVIFRTTAAAILQEFYVQRNDVDIEEQKMNIIKTATRLIKSDLKSLATSSGNYPTMDTDAESHVHFLPVTLSAFLGVLVSEK